MEGVPMSEKALDFEQAMEQLEEVVRRLEEGENTLDEALSLFERGVGLVRFCTGKLEEAEKKVEVIYASLAGDGQVVEWHADSDGFEEEVDV